MAKKKTGKAKAPKLPKRIAGIKVPKELREPGGQLLQAMNNRLLVDAAAAALAAAAKRLAEPRRAAPEPSREAPRDQPTDLAAILSSLAVEGMRRFGESNRAGPGRDEQAPAKNGSTPPTA